MAFPAISDTRCPGEVEPHKDFPPPPHLIPQVPFSPGNTTHYHTSDKPAPEAHLKAGKRATSNTQEREYQSLTHNTHAMVADAGDVLRPPPLLLRLLHWPMPPLALPPLKSHGGQGRGGCSGPHRAGRGCAHKHRQSRSSQQQPHNEVAPPARRFI